VNVAEENKRLSAVEYERMCREACAGYGPGVAAEALLFVVCKRVYHHLHGYRYDLVLPHNEEPRREVYKSALRRMLKEAQSEPFDPVEIARKYIEGV
jgi:hypothetical protein